MVGLAHVIRQTYAKVNPAQRTRAPFLRKLTSSKHARVPPDRSRPAKQTLLARRFSEGVFATIHPSCLSRRATEKLRGTTTARSWKLELRGRPPNLFRISRIILTEHRFERLKAKVVTECTSRQLLLRLRDAHSYTTAPCARLPCGPPRSHST